MLAELRSHPTYAACCFCSAFAHELSLATRRERVSWRGSRFSTTPLPGPTYSAPRVTRTAVTAS